MLRVLDLFSGIGGFSLGLERTGGFKTVAFCEIEPFCRRVLAKHWPEVPCYDDIRTLTAARLAGDGIAVDVICGGFPCQDISSAGLKRGLAGPRSGLWSDFARLIRGVRPKFAIVENVARLRSSGLERVLGDLAEIGYDATWDGIPASAVGAPHRRDRIWILAYPTRELSYGDRSSGEVWWPQPTNSRWWASEPDVGRMAHGVPGRTHRLKALGNAVVPQIPEMIGRMILAATPAQPAATHGDEDVG